MGLIKDPNLDVTQFDEIIFDEIFSDINTPGFWVAKTQEDLDKAKIIVLDGHSTILEYNQNIEDLSWTASDELGQYKYQPENVGDGIVIFSHNFYFQLTILLGTKKILVDGNFDGNNINALTLPMKDVSIDQFFQVLTKRLEEAISSELKSLGDSISVEKEKKLSIPENVLMKIGIKLSLMGIVLTNLTPKEIEDFETLDLDQSVDLEHHIIEESNEVKMEEFEKDTVKDAKKKKKGARKKQAPAKAKMDDIDILASRSRSVSSGAGPAQSIEKESYSEPAASALGGSAPSPPPPPTAAAPPPKVLAAEPTPIPESPKPAAPPPAMKPKPGIPLAEPTILEEEEEADEFGGFEDVADEDMDDQLMAKGMEMTESKMTLRYTHTSYFSRMLLNRAYPLVVKISTEEVGVKKTISSITSGEKISEKEESVVLDEEKSVVIRPEFPGCFVVPSEQEVELSDENIEVKFHVTPLALGTLDGSVKFLQTGKTVHSMHLETKVITHRVSRWLATIGASASVVPTLVAFLLNETPAQFMEDRMDNFAPSIGVNGLAILGVITAFFLFLSGFVYRMQKPRKSSSSLAFPR